jgi:hypothetical protein
MTNLTESQKAFYLAKAEYEDRFSEIRQKRVQSAEELSKRPLSDKQLDSQIAEMFAVHGQKNPNKPRSKNIQK